MQRWFLLPKWATQPQDQSGSCIILLTGTDKEVLLYSAGDQGRIPSGKRKIDDAFIGRWRNNTGSL